jgi:hypothetical protein
VPVYLRLFGRNKKTDATLQQATQEKPPTSKPKTKGIPVVKYEVADGFVTFLVTKGLTKKRWVPISEVPVAEITNIESSGNQLSLTCDGIQHNYTLKSKTQTFEGLQDQIQSLIAEQQKTTETSQKTSQTKTDLIAAIDSSIGVVDVSFDILMALHTKRVDWSVLEGHAQTIGSGLSLTGQTFPQLNVDFAKISAGIKAQMPKDVSVETLNVLKLIYSYFNNLTSSDSNEDNTKNVNNAKTAMLAYYTLNDVMFARVTGQKDDEKEFAVLENAFVSLAGESNIKVNVDELKATINKISLQEKSEVKVDDVRAFFKQQLGQF